MGMDNLKSNKGADNLCIACVEGKPSSMPHLRGEKSSMRPLELTNTDLHDAIELTETNGENYMKL